jgi:hypothetical protein
VQCFKPENAFEVREELIGARRGDLIGGGGTRPASPPKEAIEAQRRQANAAPRNDHHQPVAGEAGRAARFAGGKTRRLSPRAQDTGRRKKPGRGPKPN